MPSINEITVLGHLGRDVEIRYSQAGKAIANLSIATSYKPKNGEESTEWHRVVCFGVMADQVAGLTKGALVFAKGRVQTNKWTDKSGQERESKEIVANVCLPSTWNKKPLDGDSRAAMGNQQKQDMDDDFPF